MKDLHYAQGILHPRNGGTGLTDVGPPGSVLTSDGARPLWQDQNSNIFTSAAAIFVDPTNGNDANNGTQAAVTSLAAGVGPSAQIPGPLKTWSELRRRIGSNKLSATTCTITLVNDLPATDPMIVDFGSTGTVAIVGTPTVVKATSTITAYTPRVSATNTPNLLTDGATVWATSLVQGAMFSIVAGTGAGTAAFGITDQGAGAVRMSSFLINAAEVQPVAGSTYQVLRLTQAASASIVPTSGIFTFTSINFVSLTTLLTGALTTTFTNCAIASGASGFIGQNLNFRNVQGVSVFVFNISKVLVTGGLYTGAFSLNTSTGTFNTGATWSAASIFANQGAYANVTDLQMLNPVTQGIAFSSRSRGLIDVFAGIAAGITAPVVLDNTSQLDLTAANNRFFTSTGPNAAVKIGTSAVLAAWPAAVTTKTVDANSDAAVVHF